MWKLLNPDNELMRVIGKLADMVLLSLLWLFLSLTIVGFGPATVALYYVIVKCIRRDRGTAFKEFFHAFKESWKVSLIVGVIVLIFAVSAIFLDIPNVILMVTTGISKGFVGKILSVLKLAILVCIGLYVFPLISRFQIKTANALLMAFVLAIRNFGKTLLMLFVVIVCGLVLYAVPFTMVIVPAFPLLIMSFILEPVLKKMLLEDSENIDENTDQWYRE